MRKQIEEVFRIKFENEVGKASTVVTSLFVLLLALNFTLNLSLSSGLVLDKSTPFKYMLAVMGFFLIDMVLAYNFVS